MTTIELHPYTVANGGRTGYKAMTEAGEYCIKEASGEGSQWFAMQLFGTLVGCIGGKGETPEAAIEAAIGRGPDPITFITHTGEQVETNLGAEAARHTYEADVAKQPTYHDGTARRAWDDLGNIEQWSWGQRFKTELTPEGEQFVIPGAEREAMTDDKPQGGLW